MSDVVPKVSVYVYVQVPMRSPAETVSAAGRGPEAAVAVARAAVGAPEAEGRGALLLDGRGWVVGQERSCTAAEWRCGTYKSFNEEDDDETRSMHMRRRDEGPRGLRSNLF